jgi:hypothetical protein
MTSVFVLFILVFTSTGPVMDQIAFKTMEACQVAKADITKKAIAANLNMGSIDCNEHKIGTFS